MVFDILPIEPIAQLLVASLLGALIGIEREYKKKEAGLRTFSLVALGTCFFTITAVYFSPSYHGLEGFIQLDPTRVIQAVAVGIGFIGSGLIIKRKSQVEGLTTAAALWATSALGIGVGLKLYVLSAIGALLVIVILSFFKIIEKKLFHKA